MEKEKIYHIVRLLETFTPNELIWDYNYDKDDVRIAKLIFDFQLIN